MLSDDLLERAEISEFSDALGGDLCHFRVLFENGTDTPIRGFGSGSDREIALVKAISEFFERAVFLDHARSGDSVSSNGFACHPVLEIAKLKAELELIERDVVMTHWLMRKTPYWFTDNEWKSVASDDVSDIHRRFVDVGWSLRFGIWGMTNEKSVLISTLLPDDGSCGFGFASTCVPNGQINEGLKGLASDQRRVYSIVSARKEKGEAPFLEMSAEALTSPVDHREFYLNPAHRRGLDWFFETAGEISVGQLDLQVSHLLIPFKTPWELQVCRATSSEAQNYFVGVPKEKNLNLKRLGILASDLNRLNSQPHPLA